MILQVFQKTNLIAIFAWLRIVSFIAAIPWLFNKIRVTFMKLEPNHTVATTVADAVSCLVVLLTLFTVNGLLLRYLYKHYTHGEKRYTRSDTNKLTRT